MFSPQKMAAVSGLVGSLAALCLGAGHAYADGPSGDCRITAQGDTVCVRKNETHTDKDGTHVVEQVQDCSTGERPHVVYPEDRLVGDGSTSVGPVVDCSNTTKLPKGFKKPHVAS
ncbi:hypothetical protein QQY24_21960 [Streptomyces sp. TG1A-8]|uniref:hypothetical protein n=1 Tax=Streptomyces sp. TG1A-8 TaxID=3051385 RepID=UPI00265C0A86|nr:hypothetical protein [Streptomyces sp. TG1A-8]MDO0927941.1 hypothetical protein [Streptomyces sp. TG1A-8]